MRVKGRQFRFVAGSLGTWAAVRAAILWSGGTLGAGIGGAGIGAAGGGHPVDAALPWPRVAEAAPFRPAPGRAPVGQDASFSRGPIVPDADRPGRAPPPVASEVAPVPDQLALRDAADGSRSPASPAARPAGRDEAPLTSEALSRRASASRWSGSAYLFYRPGSGTPSLAAGGGELGGSQAAARLALQLNPDGPVRTAVAARAYAPLAGKGAEAALGFDWHPFPAVPLRFSVERRFDLDGAGRHAWSAYAAGGFYREAAAGRVAVDGYAQAGLVGLERRDLFVDGALRAGRRWRVEQATLTAGAGLWGAAQPGASRVDVGPRLAVVLPAQQHVVSLAVEGRLRVAGDAHPGSGAAMTLAVDL